MFSSKKNLFGANKSRPVVSDIKAVPHKPRSQPLHAIVKEFKKKEGQISPSSRPKRGRSWIIWTGLLVVVGFFGYVYWVRSFTVTIIPKKATFDLGPGVKMNLSAQNFQLSLAKRGEGTSQTTKELQEKAKGIILVYNTFGPEEQVLIAGTRFETKGLIFKSAERVSVPGMSGIRPGSVEVQVVAAEAGDKYNVGLADFTIPGFQGSSKFQKFYGRSKTPIEGGASGAGKVVGKNEAEKLLTQLEGSMLIELKKNFEGTIPDSYLGFPAKYEYRTTMRVTDPAIDAPGDRFFGEVRGEARTLGPERKVFAQALASALFKDKYQENVYNLHSSSKLSFQDIIVDYETKKVSFTVGGTAVFVGNIDTDDLRRKIMQANSPSALTSLFQTYPAISRVEASFRPSFLKRIPEDGDRLILIVSQ